MTNQQKILAFAGLPVILALAALGFWLWQSRPAGPAATTGATVNLPTPATGATGRLPATSTPAANSGLPVPGLTEVVPAVTGSPALTPTIRGSATETVIPATRGATTAQTASPSATTGAAAAPTIGSGRLAGGVCHFDANRADTYLRPEHYEALQPQYRSPDNLPSAPTLYRLDLAVDPAANRYSGQAEIIFWNRAPESMPGVLLRAYPDFYRNLGGSLTLRDATLDGRPLALKDAGPTYVLGQGAEVPPCNQARLRVSFEGRIPAQLREDAYAVGTFYAGQGFLALGGFYPQLGLWQRPPGRTGWEWTITSLRASSDLTAAESAFFEVNVKVPAAYLLAGSGLARAPVAAPNGQRLWRFIGGPLREFALAGGINYNLQPLEGRTTFGQVAVRVFTVNSPDPAVAARQQDFARQARDVTIATLDEFGQVIGPYPYVEYTLLQFPLTGFNGIEWPMFSQFSFELFRRAYSGQDPAFNGLVYSKPGTLVVIHEVLHQWWYNLVGNDQQAEPFLDEGLTEYCAYLLPELQARRLGLDLSAARKVSQAGLDNLRNRVRQQDLPVYGDLRVNTPASGLTLDQAGFVYYRKAPLFYEAYRARFGDEAFFSFLKNYFQRHRFKVVHYDDLAGLLAGAVPGRESEAQAFINRWLNERQLSTDLAK